MTDRRNNYIELAADYSRPGIVPEEIKPQLIALAEQINRRKEKDLPAIGSGYTAAQIEAENKEWWPTRGHRGGCYFKSEQLTFYCDVYAPKELLALLDH
jgi:hypothetical protein